MSLNSFEDIAPFFDSLEQESDRSCAVLSGVLLDDLLKELLKRVMIEDTPNRIFEYPAALSSWSAKIDAAYYFNFLSEDEYKELGHIRKIRNDFAHKLDIGFSFGSSRILKSIHELKLPHVLIKVIGLKQGHTPIALRRQMEVPRHAFLASVRMLCGFIQNRAREHEREERRNSFDDNLEFETMWKRRCWNLWDPLQHDDSSR